MYRPPHPHDPRKARIILRHLPPHAIPRPLREMAKSHRQYAERVTTVLLIALLVTVCLFTLGPGSFGDSTGRATRTTANITEVREEICYFPLEPGIDIISFNCISNRYDRASVFNNTDTGQIAGMYAYVPSSADPWKVWNPQLPWWVVHDLDTVSRLQGYVIRISGNGTIVNHTGFLAGTSNIPVVAGANLVGYPSVTNDTLPDALTTINGTFRSIRTIRNGSWLSYGSDGNGTLSDLRPYEGYWLNMTASGTWTVERNRTG